MPSTAYLMLGHGLDGPRTYRVPRGCKLVVKVQSGESVSSVDLSKILTDPYQDKYLDPMKNAEDIAKIHGSVAIFNEGDLYPNATYSLFSYWNNPSNFYNVMASGLQKWPFYNPGLATHWPVAANLPATTVVQFYENSILPDKDTVLQDLVNLEYNYEVRTVHDFIQYLSAYNLYSYTQKDLFDRVENGRLRPGIFYNFICRNIPILSNNLLISPERKLNLFATVNQSQRLQHLQNLNESVSRGLLSGNMSERALRRILTSKYNKKKNTQTRKVLKQHIEESIAHRKPFARAAYNLQKRLLARLEKAAVRMKDPDSIRYLIKHLRAEGMRLNNEKGFRLSGGGDGLSAISYFLFETPPNLIVADALVKEGALLTDTEIDKPSNNQNNEVLYKQPYGQLIHIATILGRPDIIEFLIKHGVDVNSMDNSTGMTPLNILALNGDPLNIAKILLDAGADPSIPGFVADPPMITAILHNNHNMVKTLIKYGDDINRQTVFLGLTPLMVAAQMKDMNSMGLLLAAGADKTLKDSEGRTVNDILRETGASHINPLLNQYGGHMRLLKLK